MKFLAIFLICCAIYYVDAQYCTGDRLKAVLAKCSADEEATADDVEDVLSQRKAASENAKCFRACLLQTCKVMDEFGNLDGKVHKEFLPLLAQGDVDKLHFMESVVDKCLESTKVEGKICATAEDYFDCLFTNCKSCGLDLHNLSGTTVPNNYSLINN